MRASTLQIRRAVALFGFMDKLTARQGHVGTVEDLICPITLELPLDPVTADDGNAMIEQACCLVSRKASTRKGKHPKS
jgi:hypothetical protein